MEHEETSSIHFQLPTVDNPVHLAAYDTLDRQRPGKFTNDVPPRRRVEYEVVAAELRVCWKQVLRLLFIHVLRTGVSV